MSFISRAFDMLRVFRPDTEKGYGTPASGSGNWLGNTTHGNGPHEPFAGAWQRNLDGVRGAGPNILAFSGVYSCINIISSDICRLPQQILQAGAKGNREKHVNHPAWKLLQQPNPFQTGFQFLQHYMVSKLTHGNTYVILFRDARGVVNEMYVLDPHSVMPLVAEDGSVFYRLGQDKLNTVFQPMTVDANTIAHDRCMPLFHPLIGTSPLYAGGMSAMTGARVLMNSEAFFANMSRSSGVLTSPGKIEKEVGKRLQAEWEQNYGKGGIGRTAVLSNGLKYEAMTINAADAELVNQLRWTIEDVARCYRVPSYKVSDQSRTTFKNSEQMSRDYYQGCLAYHIESYKSVMNKALGLAPGITVELDTDQLFAMETDMRYSAYGTALAAGFMSINEVRQKEDLPPVKGGEEPRVQAQYLPLSLATGVGVNIPGAVGNPAPSGTPPVDPGGDNAADPAAKARQDPQTRQTDMFDLELTVAKFKSKLDGDPDVT